jgi:hypothetical protein
MVDKSPTFRRNPPSSQDLSGRCMPGLHVPQGLDAVHLSAWSWRNGRTPRNKWLELGQRISLGNHFAPPNLVGDRSNPPSNKVIPVVSTKVQDSGEPSSALFAPEQVATSATFSSILHCQLATQIDQVQPCEPPCWWVQTIFKPRSFQVLKCSIFGYLVGFSATEISIAPSPTQPVPLLLATPPRDFPQRPPHTPRCHHRGQRGWTTTRNQATAWTSPASGWDEPCSEGPCSEHVICWQLA